MCHYEGALSPSQLMLQVYFFRRQGPRLISPAGTANGSANGFDEESARPGKKRRTTTDVVATAFPSVHPSTPITLTASAIGESFPVAGCGIGRFWAVLLLCHQIS